MINVKVKTLDSQNHDFSVEDEFTVRQFKEHIADKVNVSADLQRLIYCGRVLVDEKLLKECDVNGKVVHLVQRLPPTSNPESSTSENPPTRRPRNRNDPNVRSPLIRAIDGMVLGAMAIPMNANNGTPQAAAPSLNPSSTLCMNRITVARHMLECANNIASYLENPERQGLNNAAMDILAQQTLESTVFEVGISAVSDVDIPQYQVQNLVQAFQGAVSAAFRQNAGPNITVMQQGEGNDQNQIPTVQIFGAAPTIINMNELGSNINFNSENVVPTVVTDPIVTTALPQTPNVPPQPANAADPTGGRSRQQTTSTQTLAEVVRQMRNVQTRLEPFIQQYYEILSNDPTFDSENTTERENSQRVFDRVSEAFHYIAHAQHAISDLMLDLSTNVPRHLCCRPILVEQSAFVSSGFTVPNSLTTVIRPNGNNNETASGNNNANVVNNGTQQQQQAPTQQHQVQQQQPQVAVNPQLQVARIIQAVVNSAPMHADVHVEINPPTNAPNPTQTATNATPTTNNNNANNPPNEFTINVHLGGSNQAPRVTTATLPTTSTQTRSTARPQVHMTSLPTTQVRNIRPVPSNIFSAFDRFLPCNSHHIRDQANDQRSRSRNNQRGTRSANRSLDRETSNRNTDNSATNPPNETPDDINVTVGNFNMPIRLFGSELTIHDLLNINPSPSILNGIRNQLQTYIMTTLFAGSPITDEHMTNAINQVLILLDTFLVTLPQFDLPDYDSRASVENLIRNALPFILNLIRDDDSNDFGVRLKRSLVTFGRQLCGILFTSVGRANAERYFNQISQMAIMSYTDNESEQASFRIFQRQLMDMICQQLDSAGRQTTEEFQEFLVIRRPAPSTAAQEHSPMETDQIAEEQTRSMNVDSEEENLIITVTPMDNGEIIRPQQSDEELPTVVVGSESWHNNFPTNWLPIITRDIGRQRRQTTQEPFSDAYLSGMSSKRRKLIANSKPSTDIPEILTEGIRHTVQAAGLVNASRTSLDDVTASIAADSSVQHSYQEAMRTSVQERLRNDPDFTSDRFPNSSKYFNK